MKVGIFSTYDCYGAGSAAYRLHQALLDSRVDSEMFVGKKTKTLSTELGFPADKYMLVQKIWENTAPGDTYSAISFGLSNDVLENAVARCDVINLHWLSNFISSDNIRLIAASGKPIVVTMHDENLYTGGCHYTHGCKGYFSGCVECPQMSALCGLSEAILASKIGLLPEYAVIVTPSEWLARSARETPILKNHRIEVIQNGVDAELFNPNLRDGARKEYGFDVSQFVVLFGCQSLDDERKGMSYVIQMIGVLKDREDFERFKFVCFGSKNSELPEYIDHVGFVDSEYGLAKLYAAADVTIVPSIEDNLPNILLESLLCGTPVIGFDAGGIPEVIIDGKNGFLVPRKDSAGLSEAVAKLASTGNALRTFCREDAVVRFGTRLFAERYIRLYESLEPHSAAYHNKFSIYEKALRMESEERYFRLDQARNAFDALEKEKKYALIYEEVFRIIAREFNRRKVAIYGYGAWGKHIYDVIGDLIDYVIDKRELALSKRCPPDSLGSMRLKNIFILVALTDDGDVIELLDKNGFIVRQDYICINSIIEGICNNEQK
jgi:glycosyltransferase involved in cell wall biosynthesis